VPGSVIEFESIKNYLALEIAPIFFQKINRICIDTRFGISSDFYINGWYNQFGITSTSPRCEHKSIVFSFIWGIGLGYIIKDKFKIGLRSSISRTLSDIYNSIGDGFNDLSRRNNDFFYLNFHNVIFFNFLL